METDKIKDEPVKPFKVRTLSNDPVCLVRFRTQEEAIRWIDEVVYAVRRDSLLEELNRVQGAVNEQGERLFPNKFTMDLIVVNLVLRKWNLEIKV